eukprot:1644519-Prymnesium_polylepis.1
MPSRSRRPRAQSARRSRAARTSRRRCCRRRWTNRKIQTRRPRAQLPGCLLDGHARGRRGPSLGILLEKLPLAADSGFAPFCLPPSLSLSRRKGVRPLRVTRRVAQVGRGSGY